MAIRNIITIDAEKCDGCGKCVKACAEGAIQIIDGKARLIGEIYCDGFGTCLGSCPTGALRIEQREAQEYGQAAVEKYLAEAPGEATPISLAPAHQCPGAAQRIFTQQPGHRQYEEMASGSQLSHWPVQLMLVSPSAPYLKKANLLICADCVPFALPDFHSRYLRDRAVLVGCPKLDNLPFYFEKLKEIVKISEPASIMVVRMEVPCCNGIAQAALEARDEIAPQIPMAVHIITIDGKIKAESIE